MDIQTYKLKRQQFLEASPRYRTICRDCFQPNFACYCEFVQKFDAKIKFVILIHPIEAKRRIATGRMSHLCLENSELIVGQDYTHNAKLNAILQDQSNQPFILYPGKQSVNLTNSLTTEAQDEAASLFDKSKVPTVIVIDGTWATARKTMRLSENLKDLSRICFTPPGPSRFRVRKQPAVHCYSTIEAIHHSIELLGSSVGFNVQSRDHDKLLFVFEKMVERQLEFIRESLDNPKTTSYRRPRFLLRTQISSS